MKESNTKLKEAVEKWEKKHPLYKQLPINYETGVSFSNLNGKCLCCKKDIEENNMRGEIQQQNAMTHHIDAVGWCSECNIFTPYLFRITGKDGELSIEINDDKNGWVQKTSQKSLVNKLVNWIS